MGKHAILGGSRGLGAAVAKILREAGHEVGVASRKDPGSRPWWPADFSKEDEWPQLLTNLNEFAPEVLIYCAGGGPYGPYGAHAWKDQKWALQVTFACPAFLLSRWCQKLDLSSVRRMVFVGSEIAESRPDPGAAAYCAAKHALRGLVTTLQLEDPDRRVSLFSPGYMDTEMLPKSAWPRLNEGLVRPPALVAEELVQTLTAR